MPRKSRGTFIQDNSYHIFNRGNNKNVIFKDEEDKTYFAEKFYELFYDIKEIRILAFCIMNNHFHLLITMIKDYDVSKLMHRLCTSYSQYFNKKYKKIGHVFQDRFKSKVIYSLQGIINVKKYIEKNPVKDGYVDKSENYNWLWALGDCPRRGQSPRGDDQTPTT